MVVLKTIIITNKIGRVLIKASAISFFFSVTYLMAVGIYGGGGAVAPKRVSRWTRAKAHKFRRVEKANGQNVKTQWREKR